MKSPPVQYSDSEARDAVEAFIRGDSKDPVPPTAR
jgi:myo-inositol-1-phosphate synthase